MDQVRVNARIFGGRASIEVGSCLVLEGLIQLLCFRIVVRTVTREQRMRAEE